MIPALLPLICLFTISISLPVDIANHKQLFIEKQLIELSDRVELRANPAQKLGSLLDEQGQPIQGFVSRVIEDNGKVRLYLGAEHVQVWDSDDGLHFRPTGVTISGGIFPTIFVDPHDPVRLRKYKMF